MKQSGLSFCFLCFQNNTLFALYFVVSNYVSTAAFASEVFTAQSIKNELVHKIIMTQRVEPFQQYDLRDLSAVLSKRFLVDSRASTTHARFDFRLSLYWYVFSLYGMASSISSSNFSVRFLNGFFELLIVRINETDASSTFAHSVKLVHSSDKFRSPSVFQ